jgi:hypothetical protein
VGPARPSIRSVDLDNEHPCLTEMSSQRGAVGAGALNADSVNLTVALQPLHEGAITPRRCGKLTIAELAPEVIDHSGMMALSMRVHATGDTNRGRLSCWSWLTSSGRSGQVGTPRSGSVDKPVMGPFAQAPMRSRRPAVRVQRGHPPDRRIDPKTAIVVRLTESQTRRRTSAISSLACGTRVREVD